MQSSFSQYVKRFGIHLLIVFYSMGFQKSKIDRGPVHSNTSDTCGLFYDTTFGLRLEESVPIPYQFPEPEWVQILAAPFPLLQKNSWIEDKTRIMRAPQGKRAHSEDSIRGCRHLLTRVGFCFEIRPNLQTLNESTLSNTLWVKLGRIRAFSFHFLALGECPSFMLSYNFAKTYGFDKQPLEPGY